jgi:hypothetical protein
VKFQKFHGSFIDIRTCVHSWLGLFYFIFPFILCEIKLCSFSKCMEEYIDDYAWDYNWKKFEIMFYWDDTLINLTMFLTWYEKKLEEEMFFAIQEKAQLHFHESLMSYYVCSMVY